MALRFEDDFLKKLEYLHVVSKRAFAGQNRADRLAREARPRARVRRPPAVRARRRLPPHRLEGLQAAGPAAAAAVRRRAGPADLPVHRRQPVDGASRRSSTRRGGIAAALCYIGLAHLDRVTILPFGGELGDETHAGPRQGPHLPRVRAARADGGRRARPICAQSFKEFASRTRQQGWRSSSPTSSIRTGFEPGLKMLASLGTRRLRRARRVASATAIRARSARCGSWTPRPASCATSTSRRALAAAYARGLAGARRASSSASAAATTSATCAPTPSAPFEEIILKTFRKGRFLA